MKITKLDVMLWRPGNKPVGVRVHTDEGIYGDGEAALASGKGSAAAYGMLLDLGPLILGMDPMNTEAIWNKLYRSSFWGQNGGPVTFAGISAIDIALWDIRGKALGVPVYQLLGGKVNPKLRCCASQLQLGWRSGKMPKSTQEYAAVAREAVDEGYRSLKFNLLFYDREGKPIPAKDKLGFLRPEYLDLLEERLQAIREEVGGGVELMLENHGDHDVTASLNMAQIAQRYGVSVVEEPTTPWAENTKTISRHTDLPLAMGERLYSRWQYEPFLREGSIRLIQPDLGICGGMTEGKKIADLAAIYDVGVQCHVCGSPLGIVSALHLETAIPNFQIHEHHMLYNFSMGDKLVKYRYDPKDGYFTVPEMPGMGNEWSEWAMENPVYHTVIDENFVL